jgi:hypothetical protein
MYLATPRDTQRIIAIFQEAFIDNPHICYLLGKSRLPEKIAILTSHVIDIAMKRQGLYLSKDGEGVLIVFEADKLPLTFFEKCAQYWMVLRCFNLRNIFTIARTEKRVKALRHAQPGDLYVWFYAVSNKGLGGKTARELLHDLFDLAQEKNAAILAETSIARNMVIYKRYGFEAYNQQQFDSFPVFYMRRPAAQKD